MTLSPPEVLRQKLDDAHRTWEAALADHGYYSPQERAAFENIKQLGLSLAEARVVEDMEWTRRMLVDLMNGIRQGLDWRLDMIDRDIDKMRQLTEDIGARLSKLDQRH
jgi:hypothetical protein